MRKQSIGKVACQNYPELNQEFAQKLLDENTKELENRTYTHEVFEKFKPFLTQAIYGTTECVDPKVRVWAHEGGGFGTENWRFCQKTIIKAAFEYARQKLSKYEYDEIVAMENTRLGDKLVIEYCQDKLKEFYGYEYKTYWSEFYRYFIRDMSLFEEMWFFSFANVAGWQAWLLIKILVGIPWAIVMFVLVFILSGLERIYNFLKK